MKRLLIIVAILAAAVAVFALVRNRPSPSEAERNRAFTESMSGVTLVGSSTRPSGEYVAGPERYHIDSVTHVSGDTWLFRSRMNYHGKDIPVPIPLSVVWAGDTPVITMTDLAIPGIGTYTVRIALYRGHYAGTWSGKDGRSAHVFGKIVRQGTTP
jgi:hypothetical protein